MSKSHRLFGSRHENKERLCESQKHRPNRGHTRGPSVRHDGAERLAALHRHLVLLGHWRGLLAAAMFSGGDAICHEAKGTVIGKHDPAEHRQNDDQPSDCGIGADCFHGGRMNHIWGNVKGAFALTQRHLRTM